MRSRTNLTIIKTKWITVKIGKIWNWISIVYLGSFMQLYSLAGTPQLPPYPHAFELLYECAIAKIDDISL